MFSRKMLGAGGVTTREKHCSSKTGAWGLMSSGHESNRGARGICGNSAIFAFYDSSQAATPLQLFIAPCHVRALVCDRLLSNLPEAGPCRSCKV